jgi:hypothetical protein
MARLRSDFWVSAVLRRRGAAEAGAIFIKVDRLDGSARLYAPAPPDLDSDSGERRFTCVLESDAGTVEDRMIREIRFDSDLWLVEVEDRSGEAGV